MNYTYKYLRVSDFFQRNKDLAEIGNDSVTSTNAKKIGLVCLRAIQIYEHTRDNISREKSSLRMWIRGQRSQVRSHGQLIRYKGASKTRASLNASISNINDSVLNNIDRMSDIVNSNLSLVQLRLNKCLKYASLSDIQAYEATYLEEKKKLQDYENYKSMRIALFVLALIIPLFLINTVAQEAENIILTILFSGFIFAGDIIIVHHTNKFLKKKIDSYEKVQQSIQDLKTKKKIREQEARDFDARLASKESELDVVSPDSDKERAKRNLTQELAKSLEKEYFLLENACLSLDIEANTWLDLASKINQNSKEEEKEYRQETIQIETLYDDLAEEHTISTLKSQFGSFQEAKAFYKIAARSWQALANKLNGKE